MPDHTSRVGSGSWLVDMILWFDRKAEKTVSGQHARRSLPLYDARSRRSDTCLYLAYGSNLCAATFQGNRGIRPISAVNVLVPELRLTWSLPGIPYAEPCYANTERKTDRIRHADVHKHEQGLVGVVYEISAQDWAHILRTEGQGYVDTEVECFPLQRNTDKITTCPNQPSFGAHVVLAAEAGGGHGRPNMQPSRRYLDLLLTGAREHGLPGEYVAVLESVRPYETTRAGQVIGKSLFTVLWFVPVFVSILLERQMADGNGRIPGWVNRMVGRCFSGMWWTHQYCFKPIFGDGACSY